ncbi:MAG: DinB family protein [Caldilineaceae bacterium]|nr:DinB family protein [Caldilineaceae bacterium]
MDVRSVINSQFHAALDMLEQTIQRCPESVWYDQTPKNRAWNITYHALFYTHLYLQPTLEEFVPWPKHREEANRMPIIADPYSQADVLEYLAFCRGEVDRCTAALDLEAASGFHWLPFGKLELQFYSLRHLMMHLGEVADRLGAQAIEVEWRGMKRNA